MARAAHVDALVQARDEDYPGLFEQCPAALWEQDYACVQQMLTAMTRDTPDLRQYFRSHPERFIECLRAVRITQVNAAALALHGVTSRAALFRSFTDYLEPAVYHRLHEELLLLSQGETGSGKELVAHAIHRLSGRQGHPFIPVNCSVIPEALFESQFFGYRKGAFTGALRDTPGYFDHAHTGTLFLDEIGELNLHTQVKLLRVLEDHAYTPVGATDSRSADVHVIAATNRPLAQFMRNATFREDLFFRLNVLEIAVPPLTAA